MVSTPPVRPLRLATKALRNSVANTAACSANLRCETFERFFLQVLRNSNWSVVSKRYGRPAVKAAKIQKRVGFHTFRHTHTTLVTQNDDEVKVVQELLRHANSRITLDLLRRVCRTSGWHKVNLFGWCSTREKHWPNWT